MRISRTWALASLVFSLGCDATSEQADTALPDAALRDAAPPDAAPATLDATTEDASLLADAPMHDAFARDAALDGNAPSSLVEGGQDILFVGNSYVFVNDVPARYRAMAEVTGPVPLRLESTVMGGYRLIQHATDAASEGTPIARWLRTGTAEETAFDVVVLQEQSQISGFPESNAERMNSLRGASMLASLARAKGIDVVLYLTWGRERGDETNPGLFPSFTVMQDRLDEGYRAMAARLRSEGSHVRIAPVGAAFRVVHAQAAMAGDPTVEGTAFDALYEADGSHPSARGAYLAATVILATITGLDPRTFTGPTDLDAATAMSLREAAYAALTDARWSSEAR
jgi:hypothetical protein